MKKSHLLYLALLSALFIVSSCEKLSIPSEEETQDSSKLNTLTIKTRSITSDIQYPVKVYAFSSDGSCAASQTLNSKSDTLSLSLTKGSYHIVAISNIDGYTLPSESTLTSVITMKNEENYSSSQLQIGQADVTMGSSSQTATLVLAYKVSPVNVSLSNVPSSVTSASVTISQQYSGMNMKGEYSSGKAVTIPLTKSGDTWSTNSYVFPGSSSQTVFTISLTDASNTTTYGYTYNSPLASSTPYNLSGTYSSAEAEVLSLSASFEYQDWSTPVNLNFEFGPGASVSGETITDASVSSFPSAGTIWNSHVVAYLYDDSGSIISQEEADQLSSVNALLISLEEWTNVKSALNTSNPNEAQETASSYSEGSLSGWTIPTVDEVNNLTSLYNVTHETLDAFNTTVVSASGTSIKALTDEDANIRFLCNDANSSFVWRTAPNILKAGATVKYSLRLINHIKMNKK